MRPSPLSVLATILILVLAFGWISAEVSATKAENRMEELADSVALSKLREAGYVSEVARLREGLLAADSTSAALEEALRRSESRRYARAEVVVESRVDTVLVADTVYDTPAGPNWTARVAIEPFFGDISFSLADEHFGLTLTCAPRLEQYVVQSASDALLIGVRALSPQTDVRVAAFDVTPYLRQPATEGVRWYHLLLAAGAGAAAWEVAR